MDSGRSESDDHQQHMVPFNGDHNYAYQYAVTIRDNRTGSEDYETIIKFIEKFGKVSDLKVELTDKKGKATKRHIHGVLSTNDKLYYKKATLPGYRCYYRPIYSSGWIDYISKNRQVIEEYAFEEKGGEKISSVSLEN